MGSSGLSITSEDLLPLIGGANAPVIVDVRRRPVFDADDRVLPTAIWRDHLAVDAWIGDLPAGVPVVAYCVYGHQVGQSAASRLRLAGVDARYLAGGIESWKAAGGPVVAKRPDWCDPTASDASRWVTRERPKIDRIACPWFIRRFVDRRAEIHYVEAEWVRDAAVELRAVPFDIPDVELTHIGATCSFDTLIAAYGVTDPALLRLATIIRGADTGRPDLAPEAAGLLALSLGISASTTDDQEALRLGSVLYDSLYAWARFAAAETHNWPAAAGTPSVVAGAAR
ncbi:superoxide dismutase SodM-like protein [alpha proteobacterium BAL199]|jgi:rhodanese-related sulfurtransferase|nr:superoxide dismutase SodM-like protein [alpha proteobacterium BAL199]